MLREFKRERLRQHHEAGLGDVVNGVVHHRAHVVNAGNVDDLARLLRRHHARDGLRKEIDSL